MEKKTSALFKAIQRIQFNSTKLANDFLAGAYHSAFKGKGIEFEDVRGYVAGDDIRSIDWNVTARMNEPFVKNFKEERELPVLLLVDISASNRFGSRQTKKELIAEVASLLAFSASKNQDRVGLVLFSDIIEKYIPPKRGETHSLRMIRDLLAFEPTREKTDIAHALRFAGKVQKKASICFLISDFLSSDFDQEAKLFGKQHDFIAISVADPYEWNFPPHLLVNLEDLEDGSTLFFDSSPPIKSFLSERLDKVRELMRQIKGGYIELKTGEPYLPSIQRFFKLRSRR